MQVVEFEAYVHLSEGTEATFYCDFKEILSFMSAVLSCESCPVLIKETCHFEEGAALYFTISDYIGSAVLQLNIRKV